MALRYTEEAFEKARTSNDIELVVPLGYSLCLTYSATGMWNKLLDKIPDVIDLIEKSGRESDFFAVGLHPYSFLCSQCGSALCSLGGFEQGEVLLEKGLRSAIQVGDLASLGAAELLYGVSLTIKGDWESAIDHLEKGLKYSQEAKWHFATAVALIEIGYSCSLLGNPENGKRHAEKGLQIYREIKMEALLSVCNYFMGLIHLDLADIESAEKYMEEALRLSRKNNEEYYEGRAWIGLGRVLGKKGSQELDKAEECFLKGLEILGDQNLKPIYAQGRLSLGEFYLDTGEKEKAKENLNEAEAMFQEMGMDYWLERTRKLLERV